MLQESDKRISKFPEHLGIYQTEMSGKGGKRTQPIADEYDRVDDQRAGKVCDIKFKTIPESVQLWETKLASEYQGDKSVVQPINGGAGFQVKILAGEYASVTIEGFYDTGLLMIKGKHPLFITWANVAFPQFRNELHAQHPFPGRSMKESEETLEKAVFFGDEDKVKADKSKEGSIEILDDNEHTVVEAPNNSLTEGAGVETPSKNLSFKSAVNLDLKPPMFDYDGGTGTPRNTSTPLRLPKTPVQISKEEFALIKNTMLKVESTVSCLPEIQNQVQKCEGLEDQVRSMTGKLNKAQKDISSRDNTISQLKEKLETEGRKWENEKKELVGKLSEASNDVVKLQGEVSVLKLQLENTALLKELNTQLHRQLDTAKQAAEDAIMRHNILKEKYDSEGREPSTEVGSESQGAPCRDPIGRVDVCVKVHGQEHILSMFYRRKHTFTYACRPHKLGEVAYQLSKAEHTVGKNDEILNDIYKCETGFEAKDQARKLPFSPSWQDLKVAEVKDIMKVILNSDEEALDYLLKTGTKYIEHDVSDPFWGSGPDGNGANEYGNILMQLRDEFRLEREGGGFMVKIDKDTTALWLHDSQGGSVDYREMFGKEKVMNKTIGTVQKLQEFADNVKENTKINKIAVSVAINNLPKGMSQARGEGDITDESVSLRKHTFC